MNRRTMLTLSAMAAGSRTLRAQAAPARAAGVKRVLVVSKCHLDVGFTDTQRNVVRKYFDVYYPAAMALTAKLREEGPDRYTWTTGSWLLYQYMEQATPEQRRRMERAVADGDVAWHALPFSWQTEMLDRSLIEGALGLSASLDQRFGRKTIAAKMTDVPGHTRGIVPPLAAGGVRLLDIGVNAASTPPDVPDAFLWTVHGQSLAMLYHRHDYGGAIVIPGSDLAIDVEVRNDNGGPHTAEEVHAYYARLRSQFPGAEVRAANLSDVALAVEPYRTHLPVVTGEIGDTWIYGAASDPGKVARYREIARLRRSWIDMGRMKAGDATDRLMMPDLLLEVEHTWGTDTKSYLDYQHYRPAEIAAVDNTGGYKTMETSWQEKRDDLGAAVAALPEAMRTEAEQRLRSLRVTAADTSGLTAWPAGKLLTGRHYTVGVDPATGAITHLERKGVRRSWASAEHPLALFTYQTLSADEFADYIHRYITVETDWAPKDFGKPEIARYGAKAQEWQPRVLRMLGGTTPDADRLVIEMVIDDAAAMATGNVAWPRTLALEIRLPHATPVVELRLTAMGKVANRLPEAMWLTFAPVAPKREGWLLEKSGEPLQPGDVLRGGGRRMHAVSGPIRYADERGGLAIETLDAPVIALDQRSPIGFSKDLPTMEQGVHVSLFNNAWGTNYPQWAGGDFAYRFVLSAT